ncbi:exosporium assembly protein ExsY [Virgibacillus siamensis]|uniref:Exosporium assembly protein ExsY n=1 Tax=Virgibacillus siamensis TaxID=480071 RepID=A0ABN1G595_9BACI
MSCYKNRRMHEQKHSYNDCVCDVVRKIVEAQDEVEENGCCGSCDSAVQQLRKGRPNNGPVNTTVPFILYCAGDCEPFFGSGVFKSPGYYNREAFYGCVESPIFRAKQFVRGSNCCVKLELLLPVTDCEIIMTKVEDCNSAISHYFPADDPVTGFQATGICITVDLNNFTGITCLDPITPIPVNDFVVS